MLNKRLILKSTLIIAFATMLSKVLGLVRQQYSIYLFGGGKEYDSFVAAFRIPNALRELLAEGALSAAFIPLFAAILVSRGKEEAFSFANKVLNIALLITIAVIILGSLTSGWFMGFYHYNPQFPDATELADSLFRIMLFYLPFISLSALIMGMLNSMERFSIPALGPFFSNIAFLLALYFSYRALGIESLGYALIIGGFTYFAIQIPSLMKTGFRYRFSIGFKDKDIREFFTLFIPFALAMGIPKLNNILSNIYSDEITGANTALAQGFFIIQLPLSVFVAGISMVSLPNMAKLFEQDNLEELKSLALMGLRMVFFFTLPSAVGLMLLDYEIARLIYSDLLLLFSGGSPGRIDDLIVRNIASAQFYFAPGIIAMGLSIIFIRSFQAMKDMKTMIYTGILSVLLHLGLMTVFVSYLGWSFEGIALSITLSSFFNLILLIIILLLKVGSFAWGKTLLSMTRVLLGGLAMSLVIYSLRVFLKGVAIVGTPYWDNIISTMILIIAGSVTYIVSLYLLREEELTAVLSRLIRKLKKK